MVRAAASSERRCETRPTSVGPTKVPLSTCWTARTRRDECRHTHRCKEARGPATAGHKSAGLSRAMVLKMPMKRERPTAGATSPPSVITKPDASPLPTPMRPPEWGAREMSKCSDTNLKCSDTKLNDAAPGRRAPDTNLKCAGTNLKCSDTKLNDAAPGRRVPVASDRVR